jgi:hypothetical protein
MFNMLVLRALKQKIDGAPTMPVTPRQDHKGRRKEGGRERGLEHFGT